VPPAAQRRLVSPASRSGRHEHRLRKSAPYQLLHARQATQLALDFLFAARNAYCHYRMRLRN